MSASLPQRALLLLVSLLITACATPTRTLYDWGSYPQALALHLRQAGGDAARQASLLEEHLQRSAGAARAAPPGLHAHLALLYTQLGNESPALRHLQAEKALYPEAAAYMDFLLKNARKAAQGSPS
ncbi:MAG: DUF4810 domain-containing protein [Rubrivivax sp.]|jgi:hypothetical protein|nr:DUF4810 domain-containing protein [Rubrivivax sp.]